MKFLSYIAGCFLLAIALPLAARPLKNAKRPQNLKFPTEAQVQEMVTDAVQKEKRAPGMVVGIVDERGSRFFASGVLEKGKTNAVDADTIFEIGSITKTFTTLLLEDMVEKGEVNLEDPIGKYLPASVKTPSRGGKQITLVDLATHTSGLPRLAFSTWHMLWHGSDPYAAFRVKDFYKFLSEYELTRDIGSDFEYSNAGMGLLGHVLELREKTNYEALVINRICKRLGMNDTCLHVPVSSKARIACNHAGDEPESGWTPSDFPADGELRSTANDMLKLVSAYLGNTQTGLSNAMREIRKPRIETDLPGSKIGLGWLIHERTRVVWHDGGTRGMRAFAAFHPRERRGIILLANSDTDEDDLGEIIAGIRSYHKEATLELGIFAGYVGDYRLDPDRIFSVSRKAESLFAQVTDQNAFKLYPESKREFFCKDLDAQVTFVTDASGRATKAVLHQEGEEWNMKRIK
jgi:CubicO group peptidase (beta-lactamase class C family)